MTIVVAVCVLSVFAFLGYTAISFFSKKAEARSESDRAVFEALINTLDLEDRHVSASLQERLDDLDVEEVFSSDNFKDPWEDLPEPFEFKPQHLQLIRNARLAWDGVENGAPRILTDKPFGQQDLFRSMEELFGSDTVEAQAKAYGLMSFALAHFLERADLKPGAYALRNRTADELLQAFEGYELIKQPSDLGLDAAGRVIVDADMVKLIRAMTFHWEYGDDMHERVEEGEWPTPLVDGKRPYSQSSWHQVDMFEIITGETLKEDANGDFVFPDGLEERLTRMHFRTLGVLQVFFEQAELPQ